LGESSSITVNASDPIDPLTYQFDCDGDGLFEVGPQLANSVTCAFSTPGTFNVNVQVSDDEGDIANGSIDITVISQEQSLADVLTDLEILHMAGVISNGQANSLSQKIDNAVKKLDQGRPEKAIQQLNNFINQVNEFVTDGVMTSAEAQPLIDTTNRIINAITNTSSS